MKRAASLTMNWNEEPNAQSDTPRFLTDGLIIVMDLDRFGEYVETRGIDPYKPNIVSGDLTRLVEDFVIKHRGVLIYGLSYERGTEEVIIEIPYGHEWVDDVIRDIVELKRKVESHGVTISIVVLRDFVLAMPARNRREAYHGTPGRRRAFHLLTRLKRKKQGGLLIMV